MDNYYFPITATEGGSADLTILAELSDGGGVANPTADDYYNDLTVQKESLAETLQEFGVEASTDETFSTLVPKNNEKLQDDLATLNALTNNGNAVSLFEGNTWLKVVPPLKFPNATSAALMFKTSVVSDASAVELPNVTNVTQMYRAAKSFSSFDKLAKIDYGKITTLNAYLYDCMSLKSIPDIYAPRNTDLQQFAAYATELQTVGRLQMQPSYVKQVFQGDSKLQSIAEIDFTKVTTTNNMGTPFNGCTALTDITFVGTINVTLSFSSSPLNLESAKSVITALKDYSGTANEFAYTITFSTTTLNLLDAEGATAPNGGTWLSYIEDKKWNY